MNQFISRAYAENVQTDYSMATAGVMALGMSQVDSILPVGDVVGAVFLISVGIISLSGKSNPKDSVKCITMLV